MMARTSREIFEVMYWDSLTVTVARMYDLADRLHREGRLCESVSAVRTVGDVVGEFHRGVAGLPFGELLRNAEALDAHDYEKSLVEDFDYLRSPFDD